jgi:hypothetical protein
MRALIASIFIVALLHERDCANISDHRRAPRLSDRGGRIGKVDRNDGCDEIGEAGSTTDGIWNDRQSRRSPSRQDGGTRGMPGPAGSKAASAKDGKGDVDVVREFLRERGLRDPVVHISQIVSVNLDGDGRDEFLVSAHALQRRRQDSG